MGFSLFWIVLLLCAIIAFISYFCDKMHRASICLWDKHTLFLTLMIPFLALDMVNIFFSPFSGFFLSYSSRRVPSSLLLTRYKDENEMMTWIHMFGGKSHVSWKNEKKSARRMILPWSTHLITGKEERAFKSINYLH